MPGSPGKGRSAGSWFAALSARNRSPSSRVARTAVPMPAALRLKKCRRVSSRPVSFHGSIVHSLGVTPWGSLLGDGLVKIQDKIGNRRIRRQLDGVQLFVAARRSLADVLDSRLGLLPIPLFVPAERVEQDFALFGPRRARRGEAKRVFDSCIGGRAPFFDYPLGEFARNFEVGDVVYKVQGLGRFVSSPEPSRTHLAACGGEPVQGEPCARALPP